MTDQTVEIPAQEPARPDIRDFLTRYLKYLPWLLVCMVIGLALAYIKIRYAVPIYRVQSTMMIKNEGPGSGGKDDRLGALFMSEPMNNLLDEIEFLKSSPVIARVVRDLNLQTSYYCNGSVKSSFIYRTTPIVLHFIQNGDSNSGIAFRITAIDDRQFLLNNEKAVNYFGQPFKIGHSICMLTRDMNLDLKAFQSRNYTISWQPAIAMARGLTGAISISQGNEYSSVLTLSMKTESVDMGVDMLNTIMAVYDSLIAQDKKRIAINTANFIDDRVRSLKDSLGGVEGNLSEFKASNQTFDINDQAKSFVSDISQSEKELKTRETQLIIMNWLINYLNEPASSYKSVPVNLGIEEPTLTALFSEYNRAVLDRESNLKTTKPDNPMIKRMEANLDKMKVNMLQALANVKQAAILARDQIVKSNEQLQSQLKTMPRKSIHEQSILHQQQILQELYYFLLQKKLETSISSASTISNSKVVEPAIGSDVPVSPNNKSIYTTYLMIGLLIPAALIAILEVLNDKVNNRLEIQKATQTPILGEVGHSEGDRTLIVSTNSRGFIAEQFRIIRTNLQYITGKNERPVILVTSSFSGEGKSFVSTNMGAVMALAGKKTVVMEFDIRKPKIISGLDLKRKMGITNYIIGSANFEDLLIKVEGIDDFYVIPCGPIPPNPAELLLNPRLNELIETAKRHFEVIILDSAPVGLVSDALTLSRFADCTLYIVRRGHTPRRLLGLVNELYSNKKLPAMSVILNDVKLQGGYYGGYGYYGYYGYGYGKNNGYFEGNSGRKGLFGKRRSKGPSDKIDK